MSDMIRFTCSACGKKLKAPPEFVGRKVKCACSASQRVPGNDAESAAAPDESQQPLQGNLPRRDTTNAGISPADPPATKPQPDSNATAQNSTPVQDYYDQCYLACKVSSTYDQSLLFGTQITTKFGLSPIQIPYPPLCGTTEVTIVCPRCGKPTKTQVFVASYEERILKAGCMALFAWLLVGLLPLSSAAFGSDSGWAARSVLAVVGLLSTMVIRLWWVRCKRNEPRGLVGWPVNWIKRPAGGSISQYAHHEIFVEHKERLFRF